MPRLSPSRTRVLLLLVVLLCVTAGLVSVPAGPARAAAPAPGDVRIRIDALTPLSPGPRDTLRITGTVTNRGATDFDTSQLGLHIGRSVSSRSELHALRARPVQSELAHTPWTLGNGRLASGARVSFSVSVPISELSLISPGVYPLQLIATGFDDGTPYDLAQVSTFLPYIPPATGAAGRPTPIAWLLPLSAPPGLLADGSFSTGATGADTNTTGTVVDDVASGGRLRRMLDALTTPGVEASAAVDPAVVRSLALAAGGSYRVASDPAPRPASTAAADWLDDLRSASGVEVVGLPYADADVPALLRQGQRPLADVARSRGAEVLRSGLGERATTTIAAGIAVPPGGHVDAAGAAYYATAVDGGGAGGSTTKAQALVLAADSVPATGDNPSAVASVPGVSEKLLLSDDILNYLVTQGPGDSARLVEQEFVAELAEAHLENAASATPAGGTGSSNPQPLLIAPAAGWSPSTGWVRALLTDTARLPWLQQVQVGDLVDTAAEPRAALQYPAAARAAELPGYVVDAAAGIVTESRGLFRTPTKDDPPNPVSPQSIIQPIQDSALEAVSSSWRTDVAAAQGFLDSARNTLSALQSQVRVVASPQVTLTSKTGRVPVTIENNLQAAVDVTLELRSLDTSRVASGTTVTRTVRAGQKVQVEVEVRAASAGTFPVRLTLSTPAGQTLGAPAQVLVRSTAYGIVATVFTVAALSLLGLAVLYRAVRSLLRRHRGRQGTPARTAGSA